MVSLLSRLSPPSRCRRYLVVSASVALATCASLMIGPIISKAVAEEKVVRVQVESTRIRVSPQHWAAGVADLHYGDRLTAVSPQGDWLKVRTAGGKEGFIHVSAVTTRDLDFSVKKTSYSGAGNVHADPSDVQTASKGFSPEIERQYRSQNPSLRFDLVSEVDNLKVSDREVEAFVKSGKLGQQK